MMASTENPWVDRFFPLLSRDEIRRRVEVPPRLFTVSERDSPVQASQKFKRRLEDVYFPSAQCVEILYEWMALALDHCQNHYRDRREFLAILHGKEVPFPAFSFPICLTGLAGIGKSQLLRALSRLMPQDSSVMTLDNTVFPLQSHRVLTVQVKGSLTDILVSLTGVNGGVDTLAGIARKSAYRLGLAFLGVDEFQFLTQSDKANSRLMQMLMLIGYVGIPVLYIANFSMLHKLARRNQEDRQRLLSNLWGLFPEQPNSGDWAGMVEWHKRIAPDVFVFDAEGDAEAIHQLTGGINRAENRLLEIAFRRAMEDGRAVSLGRLETAYKSRDYAVYRADIETLEKLPYSSSLQKTRKDLCCPFDITKRSMSEETLSEKRLKHVGEQAILASLNAAERDALKVRTSRSPRKEGKKPSSVIPLNKKKPLVEQLKEDAAWFEGNS